MSKISYPKRAATIHLNRRNQLKRELKESLREYNLSEGFFDKLISFVAQAGRAWSSAASDADVSKVDYIQNDINPSEKVEDQVMALSCVCQLVGYSVDWIIEWSPDIQQRMEDLVNNMDDPEFFADESVYILESVNRLLGTAAGYLTADDLRRCSSKVADIGAMLNPADNTADSIQSMITGFEALSTMNIPEEAKKVMQQKEAIKFVEEGDGASFKRYIDEGIQSISMLPQALATLERLKIDVNSLEELIETKNEQPEDPVQTDVVNSESFRRFVREVISGN